MNTSIFIFLGVAFGLVFLLRLARIGTLLAFLAAGIISGPYVLGLWEPSETWNFIGQLGVTFLWFVMGLELNIKRLWRMRGTIFGFGAAQVLMVAMMLFPILFGLSDWTIMATIMISLMLAMSSTSNDLQILADRNELQSKLGRQTFSILLFQDLLAIPLLAMLPMLVGRTPNLGAQSIDFLIMTVGLLVGVVVVGRLLIQPLLRIVSKLKSKEAFLLAIMLNIILWVVLFEYIGLPSAIGAFLAGMLMSETVYRHQIQTDIQPYQILFLSFFFVALGLGLNLEVIMDNWFVVAMGLVGLVLVKFVGIYIVARVRKVPTREALLIAIILAQGGEFGLLILQTMKTSGIQAIPSHASEIITAVIILSMMLTPLLLLVHDKLYSAGKLLNPNRAKRINILDEDNKSPKVIICGFGRVGQTIAQMLIAKKISYVAIDMNVDEVMSGRENGFNVVYGDTTSPRILTEYGLARRKTKAVVIALNNAAIAKRTIRAAKMVYPTIKVFARVRNLTEAHDLRGEGALVTLPETIESSFMLGKEVLGTLGVSQKDADILLSRMRGDNYATLDGILDK